MLAAYICGVASWQARRERCERYAGVPMGHRSGRDLWLPRARVSSEPEGLALLSDAVSARLVVPLYEEELEVAGRSFFFGSLRLEQAAPGMLQRPKRDIVGCHIWRPLRRNGARRSLRVWSAASFPYDQGDPNCHARRGEGAHEKTRGPNAAQQNEKPKGEARDDDELDPNAGSPLLARTSLPTRSSARTFACSPVSAVRDRIAAKV